MEMGSISEVREQENKTLELMNKIAGCVVPVLQEHCNQIYYSDFFYDARKCVTNLNPGETFYFPITLLGTSIKVEGVRRGDVLYTDTIAASDCNGAVAVTRLDTDEMVTFVVEIISIG